MTAEIGTGAEPIPGQLLLPGMPGQRTPVTDQPALPGLEFPAEGGAGHAGAGHAGGGHAGGGDAELAAVAAELGALDRGGSRMAGAIRGALDMLLDGQHTGRYRWEQLHKTEKTHAGTLVEIALARTLQLADGTLLDYTIAGVDVDCKFSHRLGGWMIPPEADAKLLLLVQASDEDGTWSAGLVRAAEKNLSPGGNRDSKRALNERGRTAVRWLHARAPLQENALIRLPEPDVQRIFAPASGQQRVNELFRRAQRMRVSRTVVATVAMQDDYMKRVRDGGGARDQLRAEGIVIFGDYAGDQVLAAALGLPRPGPGEFVSARLARRVRRVQGGQGGQGDSGCDGRGYDRSVRLAGCDWLLASPADPAEPAPALPRRLPAHELRRTAMANSTRHAGRWTLEDRFASPWHYLPVEVPPGTAGITVELEYERAAGAVLDLGCLDPHRFRGWSGGARESFVITRDGATPGYLPGEIEAGTWQVMIGVHRVPPDGVPYQLTAQARPAAAGPPAVPLVPPPPPPPPPPRERPPRRVLPASPGLRWRPGDLHAHTVHSDGVLTVSELAVLAVERGLDFLAVTDHNTVSHHAELAAAARRYGITLIPGQEVTTDRGHAGAFGDLGWIDFRREPDDWLDATEAGGGLLSVNHPFAGDVSWVHPMRRRPPLVEVWHWSWLDLRWTTPLAWWQAWDPTAVPVGGSDWHRPGSDAPPGRPTTWVQCTGDEPGDVLAGLRAGRVAISAERDGPVLLRHDGDLVAVDADGTTLAGPQGPCARIRGDEARLPGTAGTHRLLDARGATLALTP